MISFSVRQKADLSDFFRELSVAFISIGGFTAVFDKTLYLYEIVLRLIYSLVISLLLLIISLVII